MVSKIAVMALVAVVAVPILLGYGMNFETVQETRYESDGDPLNVTPLIRSGTEYTYVNSNSYELNARDIWPLGTPGVPGMQGFYPDYVKTTTADSSIKVAIRTGTVPPGWSANDDLSTLQANFIQMNFNYTQPIPSPYGHIVVTFIDSNNQYIDSVDYVTSYLYDKTNKLLVISYYDGSGHLQNKFYTGATVDRLVRIQHTVNGGGSPTIATWEQYSDSSLFSKSNIDIVGGFRTYGNTLHWGRSGQYQKNILITADLNTMTDNTMFRVGPIVLFKDLTNHNVLAKWVEPSADPVQIYYDYDNPLNNTYQIELGTDKATLYYVGQWPNSIGKAPAYQTYSIDTWTYANGYDQIALYAENSTDLASAYNEPSVFTDMIPTPIVRFDASQTRAYEIPVINNATYAPGDFKTNPGTEISKIEQYGTSITFGGNTYTVNSNGTITLAGKNIPIEGMLFSSHFNGSEYDNQINGIDISASASPATITFNGKWSASISTDSYSEVTHDVTKWIPGKFAWQGVDTNFKMAGLLASLGAFIALAIYGRRSGAKVLPLLLVCGGAAFMFLLMI